MNEDDDDGVYEHEIDIQVTQSRAQPKSKSREGRGPCLDAVSVLQSRYNERSAMTTFVTLLSSFQSLMSVMYPCSWSYSYSYS